MLFEEEKKLKRNRDFGAFVMGCLSVLFISYLGVYLSNVTDIINNPDVFIIYYPLIYTLIVAKLLSFFINDTIVPDSLFIKGMVSMFLLNIANKVLAPFLFLYGKVDDISNIISYYFVIYIAPSLVYFLFLMIVYYFQSIRLKYINLKNGEYDTIIEQNNKFYEEHKKQKELDKKQKKDNKISNEKLKNNEIEEIDENKQTDIFDTAGTFVKRLSKKVEENIKK